MGELSREEILSEAQRLARSQFGGTLATIHADDGTPYPAFVFFHLTPLGEVFYGSAPDSQHARDTVATPEVAFLIDTRNVLATDWPAFDRVIVEGRAERVPPEDERYGPSVEQLAAKNWLAGYFTRTGSLYRITPRRLTLVQGLGPERHTVDFAD